MQLATAIVRVLMTELDKICTRCGARNLPERQYCWRCGKAL